MFLNQLASRKIVQNIWMQIDKWFEGTAHSAVSPRAFVEQYFQIPVRVLQVIG